MYLLAIPTGLLIGVSLGTLGAGGSILAVPVLVYLLGQSPHQATAISLLVVGIAATAGATAHWRAGRARVGTGLAFGLLGAAGSYAGTRASAAIDPHVLLLGFAALMLVAAAALARGEYRHRKRPARQDVVAQPHAPATFTWKRTAGTVGAATVVGLLTGFFGVGGGFLVVPALVLTLTLDIGAAVGTSLVVIAVNSATALVARLGAGSAPEGWPLLVVFATTVVAGVLLGNRIASQLDRHRLMTAFVGVLVLAAGLIATTNLAALC